MDRPWWEKFWWMGALVAALAGAVVVWSAVLWTDQGWVSGEEQPTEEWRDKVTQGRRDGLRKLKAAFPKAACQKSWFFRESAEVVLARGGRPEKDPQGKWTLALYDLQDRRRSVYFDPGSINGQRLFQKVKSVYPGEVQGWVLALRLKEVKGEWKADILRASPWWDETEQFAVICEGAGN